MYLTIVTKYRRRKIEINLARRIYDKMPLILSD